MALENGIVSMVVQLDVIWLLSPRRHATPATEVAELAVSDTIELDVNALMVVFRSAAATPAPLMLTKVPMLLAKNGLSTASCSALVGDVIVAFAEEYEKLLSMRV